MLGIDAIIVLAVILLAIVLFVTEWLSIDLVALLIMVLLVGSGVISPSEGVAGFSNTATLTVAFMFVLSHAILKTGALQSLGVQLSPLFRVRPGWGLASMVLLIGVMSAFMNNTPVVAVLIPVVIQIAHASNMAPSKLLIPLSYASILGGTISLVGTSTNILVSGIAINNGLEEFSMFQMAPLGLIFLGIGTIYFLVIGRKLLPDSRKSSAFTEKFELREYLAEIVLLDGFEAIGKRIMDASLVKELEMDIIELRRNGTQFSLPQGDMLLKENDILKVRCDVNKLKMLKDRVSVDLKASISIGDDNFQSRNSTLVEMVITSNSYFEGKTLREVDFRRRYRAVALAIRHREEILHEELHDVRLKAGDVILAEVKSHFVDQLKKIENNQDSPFIILSEDAFVHFNKRKFAIVFAIVGLAIALATLNIIPIMMGTIGAMVLLVILRQLNMKEVYQAINWKIVFLLAGSLSLGVAMNNSGLAQFLAGQLVQSLGEFGPIAIIGGLYMVTMLLTEVMSNNATAALLAPIAIATAIQLEVSPTPFLMTVMFAASASLLTPIGYQTNTMVYSAGEYRFRDFFKAGAILSLIFWITATLLIPVFFPF